MVNEMEMSLDDIIKSNRSQKRKPQGGNRGRLNKRDGAANKGPQRHRARRVQVSPQRKPAGIILKGRGFGGIKKEQFSRDNVNSAWKRNMREETKRGILKISDSSKILLSNLDYGVSDSDIRELFTECGALKKVAVHYDRSGRSLGTADVVFERRLDALKAIKQYNGVYLDGRTMNITSIATPIRKGGGYNHRKRMPEVGAPQKRRQQVNGGNRRKGTGGNGNRRGGPSQNRNRLTGRTNTGGRKSTYY